MITRLLFSFLLLQHLVSHAQVMPVPVVIQDQTDWCWAACCKCMLNYYGLPVSQCEVAEVTRERSGDSAFGQVNCCDPNSKCNRPNFETYFKGSIQDILQQQLGISSNGITGPLSPSGIRNQMGKQMLFVQHWTWLNGSGGHFVVGNGITGNYVYFMNPLPGEGAHIDNYDAMVNDGVHTWDFTLCISNLPPGAVPVAPAMEQRIFPNPCRGVLNIKGLGPGSTNIRIVNETGQLGYSTNVAGQTPDLTTSLNIGALPKGFYIVMINDGAKNEYYKLVIE